MSKSGTLDLFKLGRGGRTGGTSLLGLSLDGPRIEGVWLKRNNGSVSLLKSFSFALSLDPLTNDPALVGREIRNHLDSEGIRERACVTALPLKWALTVHTAIPAIPEADVPGFLEIEAERGFPCDIGTLYRGVSRYTAPDGSLRATAVGIPKAHVDLLDQVLRAAQLRPVSFTLGLPEMQPPDEPGSQGTLALAIGETQVCLQLTLGNGIAALRALEGALELEGPERSLKADVIAREIRITLGQLAPDTRAAVRRIRIFGPRDLAHRLSDEIQLRLESLDMEAEIPRGYNSLELGVHAPPDAPVSPAFSVGARRLARRGPLFEFLPPRVTVWQQYTRKYSSGKFQQAGLAAAAVLLLAAGLFGVQEWRLRRAASEWNMMKDKVTELRTLQRKTAQFKPWAGDSYRGMMVLRRLTEAFPEDGSVTAKLLEIRDPGAVVCSGVARDYQSLSKTVERLRKIPEIPDVSLGQTRGNSPNLQFTFGFVWTEGGRHAD